MAAVAARDMIEMAQRATGTESLDPANAFVTPDELLVALSGELAELYDTILENGFGDYFRSEKAFTLQAGKSRYAFVADIGASDVYEVVGVDVTWSSDIVRSAKLFMEAEHNRFRRILPTWSQLCDIWFRPLGSQIEFMPQPLAGVSVTLLYIPQFTPLASDTETFESQNSWHLMAVYGLAAYIKRKDDDELGAQSFDGLKEKQRQRVTSMASRRVEGAPPRVQRTRSYGDEDDF